MSRLSNCRELSAVELLQYEVDEQRVDVVLESLPFNLRDELRGLLQGRLCS